MCSARAGRCSHVQQPLLACQASSCSSRPSEDWTILSRPASVVTLVHGLLNHHGGGGIWHEGVGRVSPQMSKQCGVNMDQSSNAWLEEVHNLCKEFQGMLRSHAFTKTLACTHAQLHTWVRG